MATNKVAGGRFEYLYYAGTENKWKRANLNELLLGRSVVELDWQVLLLSARCRDGRYERHWHTGVMALRNDIDSLFRGRRMPHTWGRHAGLNYLGRVLDMRYPTVYHTARLDAGRHDSWRETRVRQTHRGADIWDRASLRAFNATEGWGPHPAGNDADKPAWWEI